MIQNMMRSICLIAGIATTSVYATNTHILQLGSGIEYILPVNQPQLLANPFIWTAKAVCTILSDNNNNKLSVKVTRKTGTLNGTKLSVGDSMTLILHANEKIYITAVSGAEVELLNIGEKAIRAECVVS